MRPQPFAQVRTFRQRENSGVINQARTHIPAAERDDPAPPTVAHQVIRGPRAARAAGIGVGGKTLPPFVAVPVFHAGEPRPDRVDRMLGVRTKMAELPRQQRRPAARVDQPARRDRSLARVALHHDGLPAAAVQLECFDLRGPKQFAAGGARIFQHVLVEGRTIDLKGRQPRLVMRADFHAVVELLRGRIRKPHAQPLLGELMMAEVIRQAEDPRHVTAADLGGRFAHLAIELARFLDDEDARAGLLALDHERRRGAGKRAANHYCIIVALHGSRK